jgi:beta-glucosidase
MPSISAVPQSPEPLKASVKVPLQPGASSRVTFSLDSRAFSAWDVVSHRWQLAPGTYKILVGSSSRDIRLQGQVTQN